MNILCMINALRQKNDFELLNQNRVRVDFGWYVRRHAESHSNYLCKTRIYSIQVQKYEP